MGERLHSKVAVLTGAAGGIGQVIAMRILEEGATVIITGRNKVKLEKFKKQLLTEYPSASQKIYTLIMDNSNLESVVAGAVYIHKHLGNIDILINNAGSAGPKQPICKIPIVATDLQDDAETLFEAMGSLLGGAWFVTCALAPYMNKGASIINISTIFSRTEYFGRAAYVVPKAALNQLSKEMAIEFGKDERGIRVNTIFPGPVDSERISTVFAAMDKLRNVPDGTTSAEITSKMILCNSTNNFGSLYVSKENIANTVVFLGSDESSGFTAHEFEVTRGLSTSAVNSLELIDHADIRTVDLEGKWIWILGTTDTDIVSKLTIDHCRAGAKVLVSLADQKDILAAEYKIKKLLSLDSVKFMQYDIKSFKQSNKIQEFFAKHKCYPSTIIILLDEDINEYDKSILSTPLRKIAKFIETKITIPIITAQQISNIFAYKIPKTIFVSAENLDDSPFAKIARAAIQQLVRVWRHESENSFIYQFIRVTNDSLLNLDNISKWILWLSNASQGPKAIDLRLSPQLYYSKNNGNEIDFESALGFEMQKFAGLHQHKVAIITGGSEGIGSKIARLLILSGARVVIAARDLTKLKILKNLLINDMIRIGYDEPDSRILIIPDADIGDVLTPQKIVDQTLSKFGRVDFLINNAGIAGEEQMIVDMPLDGWKRTIKSNLISNYDLIIKLLPYMRERKFGHILNISSHFGGVRHATVIYPDRSDYALSKSGQRIIVENLAEFLGPDVQINAIAPGPVFGARIRGSVDRPGLYQRRSKLIFENKRLNQVYEYMLKYSRSENTIDQLLYLLAKNNNLQNLVKQNIFVNLIEHLDCSNKSAVSSKYLLSTSLAKKLINRLRCGMYLPDYFSDDEFFRQFDDGANDAQGQFVSEEQIAIGAEHIRDKMMHALALQRMPSEMDVAREIVMYLSNTNVTGETLYPSCGLSFDRFVTVSEWISDIHAVNYSNLLGKTIMIIGGFILEQIEQAVKLYLDAGVEKIILIFKDAVIVKKLEKVLDTQCSNRVCINPIDAEDISSILIKLPLLVNNLIKKHGSPHVVVSFPMTSLESHIQDQLPSLETFENLIDEFICLNFVIAKRVNLIDGCRMIIVGESEPQKLETVSNHLVRAFAKILNGTLRTLTATAGKEGSLLSHSSRFFQIEPKSDSKRLLPVLLELSSLDFNNEVYNASIIITV